jgi:hypothetical protein
MNQFVFSFIVIMGVFLAGPAFGEFTVTGETGFSNISGANESKTGPFIKYTADASAYTLLDIGTIGAALELQFIVDLEEPSSNGNNLGDNFISVYYARNMGTGTFMFALNQSTAFSYWNIEPSLEYSGIKAGFATLDFGLWYNHKFSRKIALTAETASSNKNITRSASSLSLRHPHPDGHDDEGGGTTASGEPTVSGGAATPAFYGGGGRYSDTFGFKISAALDFGLELHYGFSAGLNKNGSDGDGGGNKDGTGLEITKIFYLDIAFNISDLIQAGLEIDDTGKDFTGFTLNPYGSFKLFGNTVAGFNLYFRNINSAEKSLEIGPSIWVMYTF